ncbi:MAG: YhdT family protein, partial [Planctomycetales bacterium]
MKDPDDQRDFAEVQGAHYEQCFKEARFVSIAWLVTLVYCVGTFATLGYLTPQERPEELDLIWGMPSWVAWGLLLPWLVQIGVAWWFALFYLK